MSITCSDSTTAAEVLKGADLTGQTYVITGGDSGIGYATAVALASRNATLLLGCRDPAGKGGEAAKNITRATGNTKVTVEKLDLASFDSVRKFAATVTSKTLQIHTLLCDAGIDHSPPSSPMTTDGFDMTFQVNFLGHFLLVEKLLPVLRQSHGRVVHVSSFASTLACSWGKMAADCEDLAELPKDAIHTPSGFNVAGAPASNYGLTKFLQVFHAAELARTEPNITAYSLHPGIVKSSMTDKLPPATLRSWCFGKFFNCPLTAEEGAATSAYVATAAVDSSSNGDYFIHCKPAVSVRSSMVATRGEAATVAYQQKVYSMAKGMVDKASSMLV